MRSSLLFICLCATLFVSCQAQNANTKSTVEAGTLVPAEYVDGKIVRIEKSNEEWKAELSSEEFHILREAGTERSFTSDLLTNKESGTYVCAACNLPLFESDTKFKSGTGWPSFYQPTDERNVLEKQDDKYGWNRVEILCARCDGHLGHVFEDGPKPTGLRYCMNGLSLDFVPEQP